MLYGARRPIPGSARYFTVPSNYRADAMRTFNPYHDYIRLAQLTEFWSPSSAWPGERITRIVGVSVECSFALIGSATRDHRPAARRAMRVEALCAGVQHQFLLAHSLLSATSQPPEALLTQHGSMLSSARFLLDADYGAVKAVRGAYPALFESLGYDIGLSRYMLPKSALPALPYDSWIRPDALIRIHDAHKYGPEDQIFAGVHRVTECWLRLAEDLLDEALSPCHNDDHQFIASRIDRAAAILRFLAEHIAVLDSMVLEDYHPLRVALKGSSGAQSSAAARVAQKADKFIRSLPGALEDLGADLVQISRTPHHRPALYELMESTADLEAALSVFFFNHYQRALRVQSRRGLGAMGEGIEILTRRFVKPGSAEFDQARFIHLLASNLEFAGDQGTLVLRAEQEAGASPPPPAPAPTSADSARNRLLTLARAVSRMDLETSCDCFAADCLIADPEGSRPYRGRQQARAWLEGLFQAISGVTLLGSTSMAGERAQACWLAVARTLAGERVRVRGKAEVTFADDTRIRTLVTQWEPSVLSPAKAHPAADCRSQKLQG